MDNNFNSYQELLNEFEQLKQHYQSLKTTCNNDLCENAGTVLPRENCKDVNQFLIDNMSKGYAYCKMIYVDGIPWDVLFIKVNPALESLRGVKNIAGKRASEVFPGVRESEPELFEIYSRVALTGQSEQFESPLKSLDKWFSVFVCSPEKEYFIAIFDVITAQKQSEKAAGESEEKFQKAFYSNPGAMMITSLEDERVIDVNNEFLISSGYAREEVVGQKASTLNFWVHPEKRTEVYSKLFKSGLLRNVEAELQGKLGQVKHILMSADVITINKEPCVLFSSQDITELKKKQESIDALSLQNQTLLQMTSDGIHIIDENGNVVETNDSFCKLLGYTREEVLNMNVADWDAKFSKEELLIKIGKLIYNPEVFTTKHRIRGGGLRDVEINAVGIAMGSHKRLCASARDITLRKSEESLLRESEQLFRAINNTSPDAIVLLDINATIILANPAACQLFGYESVLQMIGHSVLDLFIMEERIKAFEMLQQISIEGMVRNAEYSFLGKNGTSYIGEFSCSTLYDTDGKPIGMLSVTHDITKRKLAETMLRESNDKFSKVFYLNPSICGLTDLATGEYVEVNEAFYKVLGFDKDEVIGKTPIELGILTESDIKSVLEKTNSFNQLYNIDATLRTKDGSIRQVLMSAENITVNNKILRYTVVNDITERKHLEDEISRTNLELQRRNSEKDKFFSIIAHDLRSPFTGLLGLTELMTAEGNKMSIEEYDQMSNLLRESVVNVYQLLENLLEWAMVQKNMVDFTPIELRLSDIFSLSIKSIEERARQKAITIFLACPDSIGESTEVEKIFADEKMISTVLRNLLTNAIKFTKKGGEVTIGAKETEAGMVEISVTDTGVGIPADVIDKLFIAGEKVGTTGTEGEPSTGLGLILCKEFVEKHKGKIWVESREGVGSTFYFTLQLSGKKNL